MTGYKTGISAIAGTYVLLNAAGVAGAQSDAATQGWTAPTVQPDTDQDQADPAQQGWDAQDQITADDANQDQAPAPTEAEGEETAVPEAEAPAPTTPAEPATGYNPLETRLGSMRGETSTNVGSILVPGRIGDMRIRGNARVGGFFSPNPDAETMSQFPQYELSVMGDVGQGDTRFTIGGLFAYMQGWAKDPEKELEDLNATSHRVGLNATYAPEDLGILFRAEANFDWFKVYGRGDVDVRATQPSVQLGGLFAADLDQLLGVPLEVTIEGGASSPGRYSGTDIVGNTDIRRNWQLQGIGGSLMLDLGKLNIADFMSGWQAGLSGQIDQFALNSLETRTNYNLKGMLQMPLGNNALGLVEVGMRRELWENSVGSGDIDWEGYIGGRAIAYVGEVGGVPIVVEGEVRYDAEMGISILGSLNLMPGYNRREE